MFGSIHRPVQADHRPINWAAVMVAAVSSTAARVLPTVIGGLLRSLICRCDCAGSAQRRGSSGRGAVVGHGVGKAIAAAVVDGRNVRDLTAYQSHASATGAGWGDRCDGQRLPRFVGWTRFVVGQQLPIDLCPAFHLPGAFAYRPCNRCVVNFANRECDSTQVVGAEHAVVDSIDKSILPIEILQRLIGKGSIGIEQEATRLRRTGTAYQRHTQRSTIGIGIVGRNTIVDGETRCGGSRRIGRLEWYQRIFIEHIGVVDGCGGTCPARESPHSLPLRHRRPDRLESGHRRCSNGSEQTSAC